jgi:hypothetical protein
VLPFPATALNHEDPDAQLPGGLFQADRILVEQVRNALASVDCRLEAAWSERAADLMQVQCLATLHRIRDGIGQLRLLENFHRVTSHAMPTSKRSPAMHISQKIKASFMRQ